MSGRHVIDTGPLVALLNERDTHHAWAKQTLSTIAPPLFTCEAVISEACFLVRKLKDGPDTVMSLVADGIVKPTFHLTEEVDAVRLLMKRFASVPMSLADACLVRMTELEPRTTVITLDHDFTVYRRNGRKIVPHVSPASPTQLSESDARQFPREIENDKPKAVLTVAAKKRRKR